MLAINRVTAGYGGLTAIEDISLSLEDGARFGVFGHNGAGKTTLLRTTIGAHQPISGSVEFNDELIRPGNVAETVRRGLAFVPQGHNVFPTLTVERNLHISGLFFDTSFIGEVYKLFPVLDERRKQRAGTMSGGEQQMLALGMAMMTQPKWLLLDEPSTGLAPVIVRNVMGQLALISKAFGTGLIIVEQNVPATLKIIDGAMILKAGRSVFQGSAAELRDKPDLWEWF
ncbi:ABC transporter ATP-binding protein [Mesorhizobium koreense]|jgi:branched-chain amino acid transport system ATP-binding protein|uniref:ABC transporter ATP-binding protein n=1 Tax=Mesorhizobium koreense TaxID=3074855 RepID=UPI00287B5E03|nr:ABC transporter ATP-binding protein [Mesorhizobium sp. WR6]